MAEKYKLNTEDLTKLGTGALIAGTGAVLTYLVQVIPNVDFGAYTPVAVAVFGILANLVRKFIQDKQ